MSILVTGGAGYIGSVAVKELIDNGKEVIVVDNLSNGRKELIDEKALFYQVDLTNKEELNRVFKENKIDSVMHFASYKDAGESMSDLIKYVDNINGTINLLNCMVENNVKKIIFSSSAAVYGDSSKGIIDEKTSTNPINFYGFTKLKCEELIGWYHKVYGIDYVSLRYFNLAGNSSLNYVNFNAKDIFSIIMSIICKKKDKLIIFGEDYPTKDGTCIRDYIDINDLVEAHILALNVDYNGVINLGSGRGYSVKELVEKIIEVTGINFNYEFGERRKGDIYFSVASNEKAKEILGWEPKRDLKHMIKSSYEAYRNGGFV